MLNQNKQPLISVIVPVYNVEEYLDYCIETIIKQSYENLEIIIVDDGSTDTSGSICDTCATRDNRVKVIHRSNGGLSAARNTGLKYSSGEYISFVDADDFVRIDYIELMYSYLENDKSDIVICRAKKVTKDEPFNIIPPPKKEHYVYNSAITKKKMLQRIIPMYAHGKLYKADFAKKMHFPEGRIFEDIPTIWRLIKLSNRITYSSDEVYFYRQRVDSIVNRNYTHSRMDQVYFVEEIFEECKQSSLASLAASICFFVAVDNYSLVTSTFPKDKEYLIDLIKKHRRVVALCPDVGKRLRVLAVLSYISIGLVGTLGKIYKLKNILSG